MKNKKKYLGMTMALSMVIASVSPLGTLKASADGFTAVAQYDFEAGTGMSSSGIGTAPTVVADSERGNVLQFADGASSQIVTHDDDISLEEHSWKINNGSPSSLKFTNPYKGRSLNGATISFWIKLPNEEAGGVTDGEVCVGTGLSSGIVGFVDSEFRLLQHPDCKDGGHSDDWWGGRTCFGITAKPSAYFAQIHHNWILADDTDATLAYDIGTWKYCAMAITNDNIKTYVNGELVKTSEVNRGKRFLGSDEYDNPGNSGMPFLLDFLCDNMSYTFGGKASTTTLIDKNSQKPVTYGKVPSNVECYVGFTGFSPTYAGVCIDDLTFFTSAFNDGKMADLYKAAQTPGAIAVDASSASSGGTSSSASSSISAEDAAKIATSTVLINAPEGFNIGTPIPIRKGDAATGETFNALKSALDNGLPAIIETNPDWKDLHMTSKIYMMDIPLTGRELSDGKTATIEMQMPSGFDPNMTWVLRINDDGSVTKCTIASIADGKIQFITDKLCKFAIVEMSFGKGLPKTGVVDNLYFFGLGAALLACGIVLLRKKETA